VQRERPLVRVQPKDKDEVDFQWRLSDGFEAAVIFEARSIRGATGDSWRSQSSVNREGVRTSLSVVNDFLLARLLQPGGPVKFIVLCLSPASIRTGSGPQTRFVVERIKRDEYSTSREMRSGLSLCRLRCRVPRDDRRRASVRRTRAAQAYLQIESLRLGNRLKTEIAVDESAARTLIPVLSRSTADRECSEVWGSSPSGPRHSSITCAHRPDVISW